METAQILVLATVALIGLAAAGLYNRLVTLRNRCDNAWAQIGVQLKRRHDLIPNLVETVKGYAAHETSLFENVARARAAAASVSDVGRAGQTESELSHALASLIAVSEAYPALKADESFGYLMGELSGTEGKIAYARQFFNDAVMSYNTAIQQFPASMIASVAGMVHKRYFEVEPAVMAPVDVVL